MTGDKRFGEKEINGRSYVVPMLMGRKSLRLFHRLVRIVGPTLARGADAAVSLRSLGQSKLVDAAVQPDSLAKMVETFFEKCSESDLEEIAKELLQGAKVDGQELWPSKFDLLFQGNLFEGFEVITFAIEVNYRAFFDEFVGRVGTSRPTPSAA